VPYQPDAPAKGPAGRPGLATASVPRSRVGLVCEPAAAVMPHLIPRQSSKVAMSNDSLIDRLPIRIIDVSRGLQRVVVPVVASLRSRIDVSFPLVSRWRNGERTDDLA